MGKSKLEFKSDTYTFILCVIDKCVRKSNDVFCKNDIDLPIWYRRKRPEFVRINTDPIDYSDRVGPVGRQLSDYSLMQCVLAWKRLLRRWWSSWRRRWDFASLSRFFLFFSSTYRKDLGAIETTERVFLSLFIEVLEPAQCMKSRILLSQWIRKYVREINARNTKMISRKFCQKKWLMIQSKIVISTQLTEYLSIYNQ